MGDKDSSSSLSVPSDLHAILEAQKNVILSAVNTQIQGLQSNLLKAKMDLASQIALEVQPETYVFKKKGNEQQFNFNHKVIKRSSAAVNALESGNVGKAKEELNEGISLLNNRQKIVQLADKSEFGWATVQEYYVCDDLADDEADASKIKRAEKRAAARLKTLQEKKKKPGTKFSFSAPLPNTLPDLVVCPVVFLLLVVIFVPKVDTPETFSEAPLCVFDVEKEVTGPVLVPPKINSSRQDQNHDFLVFDQCEFDQSEQGIEYPSCIQGKLGANFLFWRDVVRAPQFVLDIIQNGYKILFQESPLPYLIENRSSALHQRAISELLTHGCIRETPVYPQFCNPLHVAVQSSGKLRLILDLSHLNKFIVKKSFKYEDLRTVLQMFLPVMSVFSFDLKSAYHHIDICEEHRKFLSFKWPPSNGGMKFYEFKVFPFRLTSAPSVFTKVVRQLVKYWRGRGDLILILMYLDDGIGGDMSVERSRILSDSVCHDLASSVSQINLGTYAEVSFAGIYFRFW